MGAVPLFARGEGELMNVIIKLNINLAERLGSLVVQQTAADFENPPKLSIGDTHRGGAGFAAATSGSGHRRARRNILEKLRVIRIDGSADMRIDAVLANRISCIYSTSPRNSSPGGAVV